MKKLIDYIQETEVKISIIITILLLVVSYRINMYENINLYIEAFKNVCIYIAAGLLAMIGIILTGIALILGLLDKQFRKSIKSTDENGVEIIIGQFKNITMNIGMASIVFFITYVSLFSKIYVSKIVFYIILGILVYYFIYLLFYLIILISNTLDLFKIKNIEEDLENDLDYMYVYQCANEIKIEYLIECHIRGTHDSIIDKIMKKNTVKTYKDLVEDLNYRVDLYDGISQKTKREIKEYYKNYYNIK